MDIRALSEGIADAVEAVAPSVVNVRGGRRAPSTGLAWGEDLVVTTSHSVKREEGLQVVLADGERRDAALVGRDRATDLALLRVEGGGLTPATLAEAAPRVGHLVFPVGRGRALSAVMGMVAQVAGPWTTSSGGAVDAWIDVDASLPPGFSGGPLVSAEGRVIGVNTAGLTRRGAVLPGSTVERVVTQLRTRGTVAPGYLGVGFYPGTLPDELAAQVGQADALMAVSLEPGGPGQGAGLLVGDALIHIDGQPITGLRQLFGVLGAKGAGTEVTLTVLRAGATVDLPVTLGTRARRRC